MLGGKVLSTPLDHSNLAEASGTSTAAGRRDEHPFLVQCLEQRLAALYLQLFGPIVDGNLYDPVIAECGIGYDHLQGEEDRDETDDGDADQKCSHHVLLLMIRRSCRRNP